MNDDLKNWTPRPAPQRSVLDGRYVRLEPLDIAAHGDGLYALHTLPDAAQRLRWLPDVPPENRAAFQPWLDKAQASSDPLYFVAIDKASGQVAGRQAFLRSDPANGVTEIGHVYWGPLMARRPAATEAQFLFAQYVFDTLGYRRYEWKCNSRNDPSRRAAARFGFTAEGIFRQHQIAKGENRDTSWFSIIDPEWPALRTAYQAWLSPENFGPGGEQIKTLESLRAL